MSDVNIISELKLSTNELKQLIPITKESKQMTSEISNKLDILISKIVDSFHSILSSYFKNEESYWGFISKHDNKPVTKFCIMFDTNEINEKEKEIEIWKKKGKNWILFSILENSFFESMKEIFFFINKEIKTDNNNDEIIIIKYKSDIIVILEELNKMEFYNIFNENYEKYLDYKKKNKSDTEKSSNNLSPILSRKFLEGQNNNTGEGNEYESGFELFFKTELKFDEFDSYKDDSIIIEKRTEENNNTEKQEEFEFKKYTDLGPNIVENFYNFIPKSRSGDVNSHNDENQNSNIIINSEDFISTNFRENDLRRNSGLILSTEKEYRHFPSDELYNIKKGNKYNKNDVLIYKRKKSQITNSRLLYLNNFYKKAKYFKFRYNKEKEPTITLKEQNYQCFICYKKFSTFLGFPLESIFWCSYFLRFVCKDCISNECSIIPQFILNKWCFDKFTISKKAKKIIESWYKEPVIFFKKKDKILEKIPEQVRNLKKDINIIFDYMKCDDAFEFLEKNMPNYKYIVLKENIFSLQDLIEMNNKSFIKKLKDIKNIFINHIKNECPQCKYEGEICAYCQSPELIYFYDSEYVRYSYKFQKSFHKRCKTISYESNLQHN